MRTPTRDAGRRHHRFDHQIHSRTDMTVDNLVAEPENGARLQMNGHRNLIFCIASGLGVQRRRVIAPTEVWYQEADENLTILLHTTSHTDSFTASFHGNVRSQGLLHGKTIQHIEDEKRTFSHSRSPGFF